MGDLLGKATEIIQEAEHGYVRLQNSGMLWEFYPNASGRWRDDKEWFVDAYINLPANKMEKLNAIENKAMEDSLVDFCQIPEDPKIETTKAGENIHHGMLQEDIMVTKPPHYTYGSMEVFDMMLAVFGPKKVKAYCEIAAFKYRMRAGRKDDVNRDINKALWYEEKYKSL
jgi:hypothetical protein